LALVFQQLPNKIHLEGVGCKKERKVKMQQLERKKKNEKNIHNYNKQEIHQKCFQRGQNMFFFFFQKFTEFQTETAEHKTQTSSKRNMQKEGIINS